MRDGSGSARLPTGLISFVFVIGLTFDCYDGKRGAVEGQAVLSADQQKAALPSRPGLLDMLAHSFFVGGYFVGPQFTMRKFLTVCQPDFQAVCSSSEYYAASYLPEFDNFFLFINPDMDPVFL